MNKPTLFVAGIVVGIALAAAGEAYFVRPALAPSAAHPGAVKAAEAALAHDQLRDAELSQREAAIKAKMAKLGPNAPDLNAPTMQERMGKMISTAVKQQTDLKMAALKSRLNLTDDEEQAIRDILDKQAGHASDMGQKMLAGQLSPADLKKAVADQKAQQTAVDQQMQNILTPAQYIDYQNSQNDDKKNAAQTQANAEMAQIQSSLQLTDDQKNQVFTALYSGYAQQAGVDGAKPAYDDLDVDGQMNAKEAAMQAVLTPEQFATYSKFVDSQKQMYKAILGGQTGAPVVLKP
jgi:hypothetical protein